MRWPRVNIPFQKNLAEKPNKQDVELKNLSLCCFDAVHNTFQKALKELDFDFDPFAADMYSLFKRSAARREDYMKMEEVTNITGQYL